MSPELPWVPAETAASAQLRACARELTQHSRVGMFALRLIMAGLGDPEDWLQAAMAECELELALGALEATVQDLKAAAAEWTIRTLAGEDMTTWLPEAARIAMAQLEPRSERVYLASGLHDQPQPVRLDRMSFELKEAGSSPDTGVRSRHLIRTLVCRSFSPGERLALCELYFAGRLRGVQPLSGAYASLIGRFTPQANNCWESWVQAATPSQARSLAELLAAHHQDVRQNVRQDTLDTEQPGARKDGRTGGQRMEPHRPLRPCALTAALTQLRRSTAIPRADDSGRAPVRWSRTLQGTLRPVSPVGQRIVDLMRGLDPETGRPGPRRPGRPGLQPGGAWYRALNARRAEQGRAAYPTFGLNLSPARGEDAGADLATHNLAAHTLAAHTLAAADGFGLVREDPDICRSWDAAAQVTADLLRERAADQSRSQAQPDILADVTAWGREVMKQTGLELNLESLEDRVGQLRAALTEAGLSQLSGTPVRTELIRDVHTALRCLELASEVLATAAMASGLYPEPKKNAARALRLVEAHVWRAFSPDERLGLKDLYLRSLSLGCVSLKGTYAQRLSGALRAKVGRASASLPAGPQARWYLEINARRISRGLAPYPRLGLNLERA